MQKSKFLAAGLLLLASTAWGQIKPLEFKEFDLDNGLHVILHQDKSTPIVAVSVMYNVGARNERTDRTGFAHFFEHLMFEGTENIGRGEYSKLVENAGGMLNANTDNDRTYYYEIMPSNQLELALWLESERMLHAKVDSIGIATQKRVVIEEKKQSYDNQPYGTIFQEIMKRAYKVHPYRWTTIGDPTHIMNAKDSEFNDFYKQFYVPNNAVLVIAGDIDYEQTKALVAKYYGDIPKGKVAINRVFPVEPPLTSEVRDTIFDNVQVPLIIQAYRIAAVGTDDYYALEMLNTLLSGGESSRLYKKLVDETHMAMQAGSFPMDMADPGLAFIYGFPNMGVDPKALEAAIDVEIAKTQTDLIPEEEFQKLRNQFEANIIRSSTRMASRAEDFAWTYTFLKSTNLINKKLDQYLKVTREDIKRVSNKYLVPSNRVVLYYMPKETMKM